MNNQQEESGKQKLWAWFGLSYASFVCMPRVLMCNMPEDWQKQMVTLLEAFDEFYDKMPPTALDFYIMQKGEDGRFKKLPDWITNYRHPDMKTINGFKSNG